MNAGAETHNGTLRQRERVERCVVEHAVTALFTAVLPVIHHARHRPPVSIAVTPVMAGREVGCGKRACSGGGSGWWECRTHNATQLPMAATSHNAILRIVTSVVLKVWHCCYASSAHSRPMRERWH